MLHAYDLDLVARRRYLFCSPRWEWNKCTLLSMRLCGTHFSIQGTERHHAPGGRVVEAAALDPAHIDIALVHKGFDEERKRLAAGPE